MGKSQPVSGCGLWAEMLTFVNLYIGLNVKFCQVFFASSLLQSGSPFVLRPCFVRASMGFLYRRKCQQMSTIAPFLYMTAKLKNARFWCPFCAWFWHGFGMVLIWF
jgi:hypothetical protein